MTASQAASQYGFGFLAVRKLRQLAQCIEDVQSVTGGTLKEEMKETLADMSADVQSAARDFISRHDGVRLTVQTAAAFADAFSSIARVTGRTLKQCVQSASRFVSSHHRPAVHPAFIAMAF